MSYIVMEIQKNNEGTIGTIVRQYDGKPEAESAYHMTLGAAAISGLPVHGAVIMAEDGFVLERKCYKSENAIVTVEEG